MISTRSTAYTSRWLRLTLLAALAPFVVGSLCGGDGSRGGIAVIVQTERPDCAPLFGPFPPGLGVLPLSGRAVVATSGPQTLIPFELGGAAPENVGPATPPPLPMDSDGDGEPDFLRSTALGFGTRTPILGRLSVVREGLVLVSASSYEQVLAFDPATVGLVTLSVTNPPASGEHDPADHPFLSTAGSTADRTAVATRVCVRPPVPVDSGDVAIEADCDPQMPSFYTAFTAGQAVVGDLLVVATSNLASSAEGRFRPGTLLLFSFDDGGAVPAVAPLVERPVVFTTAFNPTSVTPFATTSGRALALVGNTGAITLTSGPGSVGTNASIDVLDVATRRIAATIPMGPAALGFAGLSTDAATGLAVVGSPTQKQIYAVDLSVLDDDALYAGTGPPVLLDGSDPVHPDARIFDGDTPFEIPLRAGGPDPSICDGATNVLVGPDRDGDADHRDVYVTDKCDGTLSVLDVDLRAPDEVPLDPSRFSIERQLGIAAENVPANVGQEMEPGRMVLGPTGASGPALYFLMNRPSPALFCGLDLDY